MGVFMGGGLVGWVQHGSQPSATVDAAAGREFGFELKAGGADLGGRGGVRISVCEAVG